MEAKIRRVANQCCQRSGVITDERLARGISFLEKYWDQPVTLETLAQASGMSVFYFARRFREEVGVSPHQHLIALRIERAKAMLSDHSSRRRNLTQVAVACGFYDSSHFVRSFKRTVRMTPSEYRRRIAESVKGSDRVHE